MMNLDYGARLAWQAAVSQAMREKANWLANRLNLPIERPLSTANIRTWCIQEPALDILRQPMPSPYPDSIFGTDIYNTNFLRLKRILSLRFGIEGVLDTPAFEFSFSDGQLAEIIRRDASEGERYADRLVARMNQPAVLPPLSKTTETYQLATNWLAAVGVNLAKLEKSRLPHPVHQAQIRLAGALLPQTIYFVDWGTNYYGMYWDYHFWHTNEWHPAVTVEIGPRKELLELYVGDPTYFRNPQTLIPSKTVWRLVHTPDPPIDQLTNPVVMREFFLTPDIAAQDAALAHTPLWYYQHHLIKDMKISSTAKAELIRSITNELNHLHSVLIPYKPGDDPVYDTNQP
ncbi:MAG: hypothetical protein ACREFR_12705 [Limisphaerales bacterium]